MPAKCRQILAQLPALGQTFWPEIMLGARCRILVCSLDFSVFGLTDSNVLALRLCFLQNAASSGVNLAREFSAVFCRVGIVENLEGLKNLKNLKV
jgi:hypothetical protein